MKTLFILLFMSCKSFAIGIIELPKAEKDKLEYRVKHELNIKKVNIEVARLGGYGGSTNNFLFGKLSLADFKKIKKYFLYESNPILPDLQYSNSKKYELLDFLLPKIQATVGKNFEASEIIEGSDTLGNGEPLEADLSMNCWATAFDILRSHDRPTLSYLYTPKSSEMTSLLRDGQYSKQVEMNELKPYDYVLYLISDSSGKLELDHVAISLGLGQVFEKTGPSRIDYYQISSLEGVNRQRVAMNSSHKIVIEYRRLIKTYPDPLKIWGAKAKGLLSSSELSIFPENIIDQIVVEFYSEIGKSYNRIRPVQLLQMQWPLLY